MSTARMRRRAAARARNVYRIPVAEITLPDGTVLQVCRAEIAKPPKPRSTRRRPTWGWRTRRMLELLGNPVWNGIRPTLIVNDDAEAARLRIKSPDALDCLSFAAQALRSRLYDQLDPLPDTSPLAALLRMTRQDGAGGVEKPEWHKVTPSD